MADLSPAAQAVLEAAEKQTDLDFRYAPQIAAAALRAAADLVAPDDYTSFTEHLEWDTGMEARTDTIRENLLAIAAELEQN